MTQTFVAQIVSVAPGYDRTLVLAIELSDKSWVLSAQIPGLPRVKAKQTIERAICWPSTPPADIGGRTPCELAKRLVD